MHLDLGKFLTVLEAPFIAQTIRIVLIVSVFVKIFMRGIRVKLDRTARQRMPLPAGAVHIDAVYIAANIEGKLIGVRISRDGLISHTQRRLAAVLHAVIPPVVLAGLIPVFVIDMEVRDDTAVFPVPGLIRDHFDVRHPVLRIPAVRIFRILHIYIIGPVHRAVPAGQHRAVPFPVIFTARCAQMEPCVRIAHQVLIRPVGTLQIDLRRDTHIFVFRQGRQIFLCQCHSDSRSVLLRGSRVITSFQKRKRPVICPVIPASDGQNRIQTFLPVLTEVLRIQPHLLRIRVISINVQVMLIKPDTGIQSKEMIFSADLPVIAVLVLPPGLHIYPGIPVHFPPDRKDVPGAGLSVRDDHRFVFSIHAPGDLHRVLIVLPFVMDLRPIPIAEDFVAVLPLHIAAHFKGLVFDDCADVQIPVQCLRPKLQIVAFHPECGRVVAFGLVSVRVQDLHIDPHTFADAVPALRQVKKPQGRLRRIIIVHLDLGKFLTVLEAPFIAQTIRIILIVSVFIKIFMRGFRIEFKRTARQRMPLSADTVHIDTVRITADPYIEYIGVLRIAAIPCRIVQGDPRMSELICLNMPAVPVSPRLQSDRSLFGLIEKLQLSLGHFDLNILTIGMLRIIHIAVEGSVDPPSPAGKCDPVPHLKLIILPRVPHTQPRSALRDHIISDKHSSIKIQLVRIVLPIILQTGSVQHDHLAVFLDREALSFRQGHVKPVLIRVTHEPGNGIRILKPRQLFRVQAQPVVWFIGIYQKPAIPETVGFAVILYPHGVVLFPVSRRIQKLCVFLLGLFLRRQQPAGFVFRFILEKRLLCGNHFFYGKCFFFGKCRFFRNLFFFEEHIFSGSRFFFEEHILCKKRCFSGKHFLLIRRKSVFRIVFRIEIRFSCSKVIKNGILFRPCRSGIRLCFILCRISLCQYRRKSVFQVLHILRTGKDSLYFPFHSGDRCFFENALCSRKQFQFRFAFCFRFRQQSLLPGREPVSQSLFCSIFRFIRQECTLLHRCRRSCLRKKHNSR